MSYQVLARKWRPKTFSELVGQEHVSRALINGLDNDRLHHAFLFTGTRGVGKTTIARIFAKALNCEEGVSSDPCGKCPVCVDVDQGRFVDLIEVDGASRTKVDDTRELLDNVQYAPSRGRYKVYLIDEVHMLSTHSFNALLKTLEEPPPHVKFLLATTDPQKLPVTVLSRCMQFNLKRLSREAIAGYMETLLGEEGVAFESDAIESIALAADGSMRDGLSLLDQAIANGGGELKADEVRTMLGTVERHKLNDMLDALAEGNGQALLDSIETLAGFGPEYGSVLREIAAVFHRISMRQMVPEGSAEPEIGRWAEAFDASQVQLNYQIAVQARAQLELAPDARTGFEMAMLRMLAFSPAGAESMPAGAASTRPRQAPAQRGGASAQRPAQASSSTPPAPSAPKTATKHSSTESKTDPPLPPSADDVKSDDHSDWAGLIDRLGLRGPPAVLAVNSHLVPRGEKHFELVIDPEHNHLRTERCEEKVRAALQQLYGQDARIDFVEKKVAAVSPAMQRDQQTQARQSAAVEAMENDPVVQQLKSELDASLIEKSVRPH